MWEITKIIPFRYFHVETFTIRVIIYRDSFVDNQIQCLYIYIYKHNHQITINMLKGMDNRTNLKYLYTNIIYTHLPSISTLLSLTSLVDCLLECYLLIIIHYLPFCQSDATITIFEPSSQYDLPLKGTLLDIFVES